METTAEVREEQTYDLIDRFVVRGMREAALASLDDLSEFLGLPRSVAERCLDFLVRIGHVERDHDVVRLTDLGADSATKDIRFVRSESHQRLYVERFTHQPLPQPYYNPLVTVLSTPGGGAERRGFKPLFSTEAFRPQFVDELAARADRAAYNLPLRLQNLRVLSVTDGFLPAYLVETADRELLAYTRISDQRDDFLEAVCREAAIVQNLLDEQPAARPRAIWTDWYARRRAYGIPQLDELDSGLWRATFEPEAFGEPPRLGLTRLGSFDVSRDHFIQLWCDDEAMRRRALLERSLLFANVRTKSREELLERADAVARQLEVAPPDLVELRRYAASQVQGDRAARFAAWETALESAAGEAEGAAPER
ncbi:MAG TPA: hypothetical protein VOB72_11435 [Candidatus Dormibacteraeota bacterium]|nr:hypothetical protein [Candidatus Dormibacteraeota bacterium]